MFCARTKLTAAAVAVALVSSSAASAATATQAAPAPTSQASWTALSMLTPSGAIGLGGAAAQPTPADNPQGYQGGGGFPPIPVIVILLADIALAIYIATKHHHGTVTLPNPNSPA